jgi:hypothetical protein
VAGITGIGTTFSLPNYTGILYGLTPQDTPFFSAIGGLSGGGSTTTTEFEWSQFDLRDASQRVRLEGQDAPTPEERVRATAYNTTQIHQETVGVTYTKLAAIGNLAGLNVAGKSNPVTNELDWQTRQMLTQMTRDIEWSFLRGTYARPVDNLTERKTRGIIEAITTNVATGGDAVGTGTATAATDVVTFNAHGLADGDQVSFTAIGTGAAGLTVGTTYYVRDSLTNTFKVAATPSGAAIDITTDGTGLDIEAAGVVGTTNLNELMQTVYVNGGLSDTATATLMVPPALKPKLTQAYISGSSYSSYQEQSRNVGGVSVSTILTDFGQLNVMLNRHLPADTVLVVSLGECSPVYLEVPGKGHFFAEPLAKTGAYEKVQLYGEVGLAYGNERMHGKITGLSGV